jgi:hypothetical protein
MQRTSQLTTNNLLHGSRMDEAGVRLNGQLLLLRLLLLLLRFRIRRLCVAPSKFESQGLR